MLRYVPSDNLSEGVIDVSLR